MTIQILFIIFVTLLGLAVGSFLNVIIVRLPLIMQAEENGTPSPINIATPKSQCPNCQKPLRWWHNIPLVSFMLLKGHCAHCHCKISWRYPFVELLTALVSLCLAMHFTNIYPLGFALIFSWTLIACVFIDFEHQLLPDVLTLPLLWLGIFANLFHLFTSLQNAVIGAIAGYLVFWLVALFFEKVRNKEGLGGGDVKLLGALGAWLGWQALPFIVLISSVLCLVVLGTLITLKKHKASAPFPYGPFLAIAGFGMLFFHWV